jgi:hypothetical protein
VPEFEPRVEDDWFVFVFDGATWIPVTAPLTKNGAEDKKDHLSWDVRFSGSELRVIRRRITLEEEKD